MRISLNGREADAGGAQTVAELVGRFELPPETILIEHNGVALHRHEWGRQNLAEGDRVEFVCVVAGG
jgi:thiamine biosynthesis protein ThiS